MTRYLPILQPDGTMIERADLFLMACMSYEDSQDSAVVRQLYEFLLRSDNSQPRLNVLEFDLERRQLRRNLRLRLHAAHTVLELYRIQATVGIVPNLGMAEKLVAYNQRAFDHKRAQIDSLMREVRKGFASYRNTAHLQAAMVASGSDYAAIETSEPGTIALLARARTFELLMDSLTEKSSAAWDPWRVPSHIEPDRRPLDVAPL